MKRNWVPRSLSLAVLLMLTAWSITPTSSFQPQSRLWVEGTSTIHSWEMTAGSFDGVVDAPSGDNVSAVSVTVPVRGLTSKNGGMDKKAYEALKAKSHPNITYKLKAADLAKAVQSGTFELKTTGQLTIAGVTKPVTFAVKGEQVDENRTRYTGSTPLNMSDYGIDPPTAMLGTLKTGDRVVVHFDVIVAH